jgi:hypothetical protein
LEHDRSVVARLDRVRIARAATKTARERRSAAQGHTQRSSPPGCRCHVPGVSFTFSDIRGWAGGAGGATCEPGGVRPRRLVRRSRCGVWMATGWSRELVGGAWARTESGARKSSPTFRSCACRDVVHVCSSRWSRSNWRPVRAAPRSEKEEDFHLIVICDSRSSAPFTRELPPICEQTERGHSGAIVARHTCVMRHERGFTPLPSRGGNHTHSTDTAVCPAPIHDTAV